MPPHNAPRKCAVCNRRKAAHLFYASQLKLKRKQPTCKSCMKKSPAHARSKDAYYRRTYDISYAEYLQMYEDQEGRCFVCQRKAGLRSLAVDHDHAKEEELGMRESIRGLLCRACNEYIGHIRDSEVAAMRLRRYLIRPTWAERNRLQ